MAAMLIEIKSRMLLPPKKTAEGEEAEDPRAELVRRLLEYEQMKAAAFRLNDMPQLGRDVLRAQVYIEQSLQPRFPDVNVVDLQEAWRDILRRAKLIQHHKITREELSVREHMSMVLKKLQGRKFVEFEDLFDVRRGTPVLIVTFIATLELAKETLIEVTQAEAYAPIYVRLAYQPAWDNKQQEATRVERPSPAISTSSSSAVASPACPPRCTWRPRTGWRSSPSAP